jgi:hypothetical protein
MPRYQARGLSEIEVEDIKKKASEWIASNEGKQAVRAGLDAANRITEELDEARKLDPKTFNRPITL